MSELARQVRHRLEAALAEALRVGRVLARRRRTRPTLSVAVPLPAKLSSMPTASTRTLNRPLARNADERADVARLRLGQQALLVKAEDANVAVTLKRILDFDLALVEPAEQEALGVERDDAAAGLYDEAAVILRQPASPGTRRRARRGRAEASRRQRPSASRPKYGFAECAVVDLACKEAVKNALSATKALPGCTRRAGSRA